MMKWTKCAIRFLRISRPGVRVPSIAPRKTSTHCVLVFLFCLRDGRGSNRAAAHSAVSKATVRLCLARGSQRLGMSTKKDVARPFGLGMWWAVQNSNSNKQRQGITVAVCPAFCFASPYIVRFGSIAAYVRTWSVRTYAGKRASSDI